MRITRIIASNWRNFKTLDVSLGSRLFVVGPNAAGKSNFLDLFRFLEDMASAGGGLATAIDKRGGFGKVRSLFARNNDKGRLVIEVHLADGEDTWTYRLAIRGEGQGRNRPVVDEEVVTHNGSVIVNRPDKPDREDPELLTQTNLEQISANRPFRVLAEHLSRVRYFHPVPQVIRDPARAGGAGDAFGGDFIAAMNGAQAKTREAWLRRIQGALQAAIPEFETLEIEVDAYGRPHLVAGYRNWRVNPTRHSEVEFSDGTLRLIGLLWAVVSAPSDGGLLLLEEPELSLNASIVRTLPSVLATAQRDKGMQVVLSTHAPEILDDEGILSDEVLVLRVTGDGTTADLLSNIPDVEGELAAELPHSETIQSLIDPPDLRELVVAGSSRR